MITLTFLMLANIYFQKYNRYKFLESYLYCNNGDLEPRQKSILDSICKTGTGLDL